MSARRATAAAALVFVLAAALAGCAASSVSGTGVAATRSSSSPVPSSGSGTTFARATQPTRLAQQAFDALVGATSVEMKERDTRSNGTTTSFGGHWGAHSSEVSFPVHGLLLTAIIADGGIWVQAPPALWLHAASAAQRAILAPKLAGKWLDVPPHTKAAKDYTRFTSLRSLTGSQHGWFTKASPFVRAGRRTVDGVPAVALRNPRRHLTLYVAARGTPYPIKAVQTKPTEHDVTVFDHFDQPYSAQPPPVGLVVDGSIIFH